MKFIKPTMRFDYINPAQTVQDHMVKHNWIEDDNANILMPYFMLADANKYLQGLYIGFFEDTYFEEVRCIIESDYHAYRCTDEQMLFCHKISNEEYYSIQKLVDGKCIDDDILIYNKDGCDKNE